MTKYMKNQGSNCKLVILETNSNVNMDNLIGKLIHEKKKHTKKYVSGTGGIGVIDG